MIEGNIIEERDDTGYKEWAIAMHKLRAEREARQLVLFHADNRKTEDAIKSRGEIPSWYSCQRCGLDFCSDKVLIIKIAEEPICKICNGEIKGEVENEQG